MAQLTKRGIIAAVVCSDTFMKLGSAQAKVLGVPDLPPCTSSCARKG